MTMHNRITMTTAAMMMISGCFESVPEPSGAGGTESGYASGGSGPWCPGDTGYGDAGDVGDDGGPATSTSGGASDGTSGTTGGTTGGNLVPCDEPVCTNPDLCRASYVSTSDERKIYMFKRPPLTGLYSPCAYDPYDDDVVYENCDPGVCFWTDGVRIGTQNSSLMYRAGICTMPCETDADCLPAEGLEDWPMKCYSVDPLKFPGGKLCGFVTGTRASNCPAGYLMGWYDSQLIGCLYVPPNF